MNSIPIDFLDRKHLFLSMLRLQSTLRDIWSFALVSTSMRSVPLHRAYAAQTMAVPHQDLLLVRSIDLVLILHVLHYTPYQAFGTIRSVVDYHHGKSEVSRSSVSPSSTASRSESHSSPSFSAVRQRAIRPSTALSRQPEVLSSLQIRRNATAEAGENKSGHISVTGSTGARGY
ncbi:hypothetical protein KC367_g191 [Hortaea werneckii]|nr:hypothetical protein KC367_g191 [Hortaea werneckii]